MTTTTYAIALGGNVWSLYGAPAQAIGAALARIGGVRAASPVFASAAVGPSTRTFANAAALVDSHLAPPAMLARLKAIERAMGRRRGQRWGARVIDLDIVLWSGGCWRSRRLLIPHPRFAERRFVLAPLATIAPGWREPASGRSVRQLLAMVDRRRPRT